MQIEFNAQTIDETVKNIAVQMMIAAQTAPKGRGVDTLNFLVLTGAEKDQLAATMDKIALRDKLDFFARDAQNIRSASAVLLIGTDNSVRGLNCALCGHATCSQKPVNQPCVFNEVDLGIAIGSAVSSAGMFKVDNRVMYSAGKTAMEMNLMKKTVTTIFAIPLSVAAKSIFYDRK